MQNIYAKQNLSSQELQLLSSEMDNKKKSTTTTWLLWLFLGGIGGHRYYLGKTGTAIAMTLTLGGLGVWTLIDLFLISGMLSKQNAEIESKIISELQLMKNARSREA
jgi:TM2 domain-containing membrane protein YozV